MLYRCFSTNFNIQNLFHRNSILKPVGRWLPRVLLRIGFTLNIRGRHSGRCSSRSRMPPDQKSEGKCGEQRNALNASRLRKMEIRKRLPAPEKRQNHFVKAAGSGGAQFGIVHTRIRFRHTGGWSAHQYPERKPFRVKQEGSALSQRKTYAPPSIYGSRIHRPQSDGSGQ